MGLAMEVIDTFNTNSNAVLTALAPFPGDTLTVRNFENPANAFLVDTWSAAATASIYRIRSPKLHDNVQGIRFRTVAAAVRALLSELEVQQLYAQDTLIAELAGGAAETDGASLLVYYQDLPGSNARLSSIDAITPRIVNLVNVEVAVGAGAAVGTRIAGVAINATFDLLIANTDYALLGYETDTTGLSVGVRGPDTGNYRVGGPMTTERIETRDWFVRLNRKLGLPTIPIINSANKGGTLVDNAQVVAGAASNITLAMAELRP